MKILPITNHWALEDWNLIQILEKHFIDIFIPIIKEERFVPESVELFSNHVKMHLIYNNTKTLTLTSNLNKDGNLHFSLYMQISPKQTHPFQDFSFIKFFRSKNINFKYDYFFDASKDHFEENALLFLKSLSVLIVKSLPDIFQLPVLPSGFSTIDESIF